jgi:acetoin utilization protein AcuB
VLVRDKMTRDVITITPDQSLRMAKERMRKHNIRRLPVVRDGKLVGILTDRDVRQAWAHPPPACRPTSCSICSIASRWQR